MQVNRQALTLMLAGRQRIPDPVQSMRKLVSSPPPLPHTRIVEKLLLLVSANDPPGLGLDTHPNTHLKHSVQAIPIAGA